MGKKILASLCLIALVISSAGCGGVQVQLPPKDKLSDSVKILAVMEFSDVRQAKEKGEYDNPAKIIQEKIISALAGQGNLKIIEREQLDKILAEQRLQASGLVDNASAAEIGKLLGADGILVGTITEYGRTIYPKARLTVNVRVVDAKTGLVKWATEIKGRKANFAYPVELLKDIIDETVTKIIAEMK
jgi:curli biogenesis system outer membrane secretion channel CsgG